MEKNNKNKKYGVLIALSIILSVLIIIIYQIIAADKYFPRTLIGDTDISFLTEGQAIVKFQEKFDQRTKQQLTFTSDNQTFTINIAALFATLDYSVFDLAFNFGRGRDFVDSLEKQFQILFLTYRPTPKINMSLDSQIQTIQAAINKPSQNAQLIFSETSQEGSSSAQIQIKEGVNGFALDKDLIEKQIKNFLAFGRYEDSLPVRKIPPVVSTEYVEKAKAALEQLQQTPVKLVFDQKNWTLDAKQLLALLDLETGQNLLDQKKTYIYLHGIASEIDQNVEEGLFEFNPDTKKATAFKPSREGRKLDIDTTYQLLTDSLNNGSKIINLPVSKILPKIQTQDVNSLGIKELLGRGMSNFAGSISNRIFNISLTAAKINGVLVAPGDTFSFNQTMGDISAAAGFKQGYVIKEGRTVLDDGGGVCQDSTTLFRAVLNAGLPVIKRTAHAYRVGYYERGFPPGLDATIFSPSVDFQFKNNTPGHILIQAYTNGTTLYFDLYGTSDNRITSLTKSVVTNQIPPPPDLRQDDPTLPKGTVKQVDWSAWGATVTFNRTVVRNGETIVSETWKSVYKPWQAIYLIGTKEN